MFKVKNYILPLPFQKLSDEVGNAYNLRNQNTWAIMVVMCQSASWCTGHDEGGRKDGTILGVLLSTILRGEKHQSVLWFNGEENE